MLSRQIKQLLGGLLCLAIGLMQAESVIAAGSTISNQAPALETHREWVTKELQAIGTDPSFKDSEKGLDVEAVLKKYSQVKQRFIEKRMAEYQREVLTDNGIASARAGRVGLFKGRAWRKDYVTVTAVGRIWNPKSYDYKELSKSGRRKHFIKELPNGYSLEVRARQVFATNTSRGHCWLKAQLIVHFERDPLWIAVQCESDWQQLQSKKKG